MRSLAQRMLTVVLGLLGMTNLVFAESGDFKSRFELVASARENEEVVWNSRLHQHEFFGDRGLEIMKALDGLVRALDEKPGELLSAYRALSVDVKAGLLADSVNRRAEPMDLLSIALKLRLEDALKAEFKGEYAVDRSEVWSLSKYRWKIFFDPEIDLRSGVAVIRAPGLMNRKFLLACAAGDSRSEGRAPLAEGQALTFAGVRFEERTELTLWKCGNRLFWGDWKTISLEGQWTESSELLFPETTRVLVTVGLQSRIPDGMISGVRRFAEYRGGLKFVSDQEVSLKVALQERIPKSQILYPLVYAAGGSMTFFQEASKGRELIFEKTHESGRKVLVHVLLPTQEGPSVILSEAELTELFRAQRAQSQELVLVDLACFSEKYLNDWATTVVASLKEGEVARLPLIVGSQRGQQGEQLMEVLPQVEIVLSSLNRILEQPRIERSAFLSGLNEGSAVTKFLNWGSRQWVRWGLGSEALNFSFQEVSTDDPAYQELLKAPERLVFKLTEKRKDGLDSRELNPFAGKGM